MKTAVKPLRSLTLIACVARDGGIGFQNRLLWRHPLDMRHFRQHTTGHTVLMGRLTWESLPGAFRPLPERENLVLSRNRAYQAPGARVVCSLDEALHPSNPTTTHAHPPQGDPSSAHATLEPLSQAQVSQAQVSQASQASQASQVFVIGGGQLYGALLPQATALLLTEVDAVFEADTYFPNWHREDFKVTQRERHTDAGGVAFEFVSYLRKTS
jgi:dihydrofolate reductase